MNPLLRISITADEIHKRLGPNQALAGLNAEFRANRIHGLIGPEGAGKTTLLRTILGLLRPDRGSVSYFSEGRAVPLETLRPAVAYMPQQQSLYPDLSIDEHLEFFRELHRIPTANFEMRRKELLQMTRLAEFSGRPAGQLSGGMYKKLGLMCALLPSPSVLLLDEPTNGVDPISRREFWELLHRLGEDGILILFATAYMDEAERCSEVHLLNQGRILAHGEPRALLRDEGVANFDALFLRKEGLA